MTPLIFEPDPWYRVSIEIQYAFVFLLFLPILMVFLPLPRSRPVGVLYWMVFSLQATLLVFETAWKLGKGIQLAGVCLPPILVLLANAGWVQEMAARIPSGTDEGERREAMRKLSRRLWGSLLPLPCLMLFVHLYSPDWLSRYQSPSECSSIPLEILLALLGPPTLGLLFSRPRKRADGALYWLALVWMLTVLGMWTYGPGSLFGYVISNGGMLRIAFPGLALGLLTHAFWMRRLALRLPSGLAKEGLRREMRWLSHRLWTPLLVLSILLLLLHSLQVIWFITDFPGPMIGMG